VKPREAAGKLDVDIDLAGHWVMVLEATANVLLATNSWTFKHLHFFVYVDLPIAFVMRN